MEPSLKDSQITWNGEVEVKKELFRNTLLYSTHLMTEQEFQSVSFKFLTSAADSKESLNLNFVNGDFKQLEGEKADALFKMAIHNEIQK